MQEMLELTFMQNAFIGSMLVSIACGLIGSLIIINKMGFIAGGISHGAYGGIGLSFYFGFAPLLGASVFCVFLAILIAYITSKNSERFDTAIGIIWSLGMAIGIIFTDLSPGYTSDILGYLFGSILTINKTIIYFTAACDIVFLIIIILFYRQFMAISFDSEFAKLRGINATLFYYILIIMISLSIVLTIQIIGLILVIALLTIPAYIAERFSKNLGMMMFFSSCISSILCIIGLIVSYYLNLTSSATIISVAAILFFITLFVCSIKNKIKSKI